MEYNFIRIPRDIVEKTLAPRCDQEKGGYDRDKREPYAVFFRYVNHRVPRLNPFFTMICVRKGDRGIEEMMGMVEITL
jgi:hypothetical protein